MSHILGRPHKIPGYLYLTPGGHLNYWNYLSIKRLETSGFILESFTYVYPHKEQFGKQFFVRRVAYTLNAWFGLNLFPEFIAIFKKR